MINAKVSILKYFKDTLSNNWADEYIAKKKLKKEKIREKEVEEAVIIEETKEEFKPIFSWEDFEKLSDEAQNQLTSIAYENYLSETESRDNKTKKQAPSLGHIPVVNQGPKVGRNDPCPCGSGKKYKNCCGKNA